jgi:hypothetical protein
MAQDANAPSRTWKVISWLVLFVFLSLGIYWLFRTPNVGKGGLFLAMGATLMPLFWEKVGRAGRMSWIAMLFLLLFVESRAIDKASAESARAEQETRNIANQQLTNISFLRFQITTARAQLDRIELAQKAARGNQQKLDSLSAEKAALQEQISSANRNLFLSMAPLILKEMEAWSAKWNRDDSPYDNQRKLWPMNHPNATEQERDAALKVIFDQRASMNAQNTTDVLLTMATADQLRQELLRGFEMTPDDIKIASIFADVLQGTPIDWNQMRRATAYMETLVKKQPGPTN